MTPELDLQATPLVNPDAVLHVHGFYVKNSEGKYQDGYVETIQYALSDREILQVNLAQSADLIALT